MFFHKMLGAATAALFATTAFAGTLILDTGTANWSVITPASVNANGTAVAVNPANSTWVVPTGTSKWVSYAAGAGTIGMGCCNSGTYTYTLNFATPGIGSGLLNYNFSGDNTGMIAIYENGSLLGTVQSSGNSSGNAFSTSTIGSIAIQSTSLNDTFQIVGTVVNLRIPVDTSQPETSNPTGFLLAGTATTGPVLPNPLAIPEPSSFAFLGLGVSVLAAARMRRN